MLPGAFVDGGKKPDDTAVFSKFVGKVAERAESRNDNNADPHE